MCVCVYVCVFTAEDIFSKQKQDTEGQRQPKNIYDNLVY